MICIARFRKAYVTVRITISLFFSRSRKLRLSSRLSKHEIGTLGGLYDAKMMKGLALGGSISMHINSKDLLGRLSRSLKLSV